MTEKRVSQTQIWCRLKDWAFCSHGSRAPDQSLKRTDSQGFLLSVVYQCLTDCHVLHCVCSLKDGWKLCDSSWIRQTEHIRCSSDSQHCLDRSKPVCDLPLAVLLMKWQQDWGSGGWGVICIGCDASGQLWQKQTQQTVCADSASLTFKLRMDLIDQQTLSLLSLLASATISDCSFTFASPCAPACGCGRPNAAFTNLLVSLYASSDSLSVSTSVLIPAVACF